MRLVGKALRTDECHENRFPTGFNLSMLGFVVAGQFVTVAYYPFLWIHLAFVVVFFRIFKNIKV